MDAAVDTAITALGLAERIDGTRSDDIRRDLAALIESGEIPRGARLPTIRDVAAALETSVSAVADAWAVLRRDGLLDTRRRGGTTVAALEPAESRSAALPGTGITDLARASADPALLPDPTASLLAALDPLMPPERTPITPALRAAAARLPFPGEEAIAVPGSHSGMHLVTAALVSPGDTVAVEDPSCVRNLALFRSLGARVVTFRADAEGPVPESLAAALTHSPVLVAFQPSAAIPIGSTLTERRRDALAALLETAPGRPWVLEEDSAGPLASGASLAGLLPERVVRVVHLARAYGAELQTALVTGSREPLERVAGRQRREGAKASPLLQDALAGLLADPAVDALVAEAAAVYRRRNAAFAEALAEHGVVAGGAGGFFAWVPVADERDAVLALAGSGIAVSPGSRSRFEPGEGDFVRVATTRLPDDPERLESIAVAVARAATHTMISEDE